MGASRSELAKQFGDPHVVSYRFPEGVIALLKAAARMERVTDTEFVIRAVLDRAGWKWDTVPAHENQEPDSGD